MYGKFIEEKTLTFKNYFQYDFGNIEYNEDGWIVDSLGNALIQ